MPVQTHIPLLEEILGGYEKIIGSDFLAYKNHVYRVVSFCSELRQLTDADLQKVIIAGCFHDLGIWTANTFDYLEPSITLARSHLVSHGQKIWFDEITLMISQHHKLRPYTGHSKSLVEVFRQADWIDVSLGLLKFGLGNLQIRNIRVAFPNTGFHKRLAQLTWREFNRHPFKPLPMMKW